jgi:hypothetical protein
MATRSRKRRLFDGARYSADSFAADVSRETLAPFDARQSAPGAPLISNAPSRPPHGSAVTSFRDTSMRAELARCRGSWRVVDRQNWYPKEIGRYLVFKGSVAVEGISLTIAGAD